MATIRNPKVNPLTALEDKLRGAAPLRFQETRATADGIELVAIDTQTGQVALVTLSPVNRGVCTGCGHVAHDAAERCEAVRTFTKDPCPCAVWAPRFPAPDYAMDSRD